jgi:hypothetical protein
MVCLLASPSQAHLGKSIYVQARKMLNFGNILGSATKALPYDRISGQPVFQVTTSWGSSYMSMERKDDLEESGMADTLSPTSSSPQSLSEDQNEYRTVCLYFLDPDDALAVHAELKQVDSLEKADIRITTCSLGKALRQASNLGHGIVTGAPIEANTGKLKTVEEGGSIRYKILPPKRQLFYAARCVGKERVGLFGETAAEDAQTAVMGNSALEGSNLMRRREKRERKGPPRARTTMEAQNAHMEGYSGIPVFHAPCMARKQPKLKQLISGCSRQEIPIFFNYEDLEDAWAVMKKTNGGVGIPDKPPNVEVYNLWDVLTSMDKDAWKSKKAASLSGNKFDIMKPLRKRFSGKEAPGLGDITFVPSSRAIEYKEAISARGNGKARLRPMR